MILCWEAVVQTAQREGREVWGDVTASPDRRGREICRTKETKSSEKTGLLGRSPPGTRCTFGEGKNGQRIRVAGMWEKQVCKGWRTAPEWPHPRLCKTRTGDAKEI